jgi:RimJ/RimL family protein N-acetyltransferase
MKFEKYEVRLMKKEDTLPYYQLIENNRPRLEDFIAGIVSKTKNRTDTEIFIDEIIEKNTNRTYFPYVVIDTTNQEFIGFFDVKNIDWNIPKAEIGYFINEKHTGKGLAEKTLNKIIDHFFFDLKFSKLLLRIHQDNKSSIYVAEKCGFISEGLIRNDYKKGNGEIVDLIYYGKTNKTIKQH